MTAAFVFCSICGFPKPNAGGAATTCECAPCKSRAVEEALSIFERLSIRRLAFISRDVLKRIEGVAW